MAPKHKGKKSKKQDDDDYWCVHLIVGRLHPCSDRSRAYREKAGTSVAGNNVDGPGDASGDEFASSQPKGAFSTFTSLGEENADGGAEEDFGGLMVCTLAFM